MSGATAGSNMPNTICTKRSNIMDATAVRPITNAASCGTHGNNAGANIIVGGMNTSIVGTTNAIGTTMITTGIDASAVGAADGAIRPPSERGQIEATSAIDHDLCQRRRFSSQSVHACDSLLGWSRAGTRGDQSTYKKEQPMTLVAARSCA